MNPTIEPDQIRPGMVVTDDNGCDWVAALGRDGKVLLFEIHLGTPADYVNDHHGPLHLQLEPGAPVIYDNPHTGKKETGWLYSGPSWNPDRINLDWAGDGRQMTAHLVDPTRVRPATI